MAIERIRGRKLQSIRERVLRDNPLCVMCAANNIVSIATQVDHIIALTNGGTDDPNDDSNRQGLCDPCHEIKTNADMGYKPRMTVGLDGWPEVATSLNARPRWRRAEVKRG